MDTRRFDDLSRSLATGSSRRSLLRGLLGGAAALAGLGAGSTAAAPKGKVDVCHYDADSGTYHKININRNAYDAHIAHGDLVTCEGNRRLDMETCSCVCAETECDTGSTFNPATCACERQTSTCTEVGQSCGNYSICMRLTGTSPEQLACIDIYASGCNINAGCTSSTDCTNRNNLCVDDDTGVFALGSYCPDAESYCAVRGPRT
jgi:hypothetical protein